MFPAMAGLLHVSGVNDPDLEVAAMRDAHRVLVDERDRLGNVAQIQALRAGGYAGPLSFEPFAQSVQQAKDLAGDLRWNIAFIESELAAKAA